ATLPAVPALHLSEVQPRNLSGITDRFGEREPWIELANTGTTDVSLDGWFLSPDPADLGRWGFPTGSVIRPGQLLVVFADAEPGESSATEWHTAFRLAPTNGIVVLSRLQPGGIAPVDALAYANAAADAAFVPDPSSAAGVTRVAAPSPGQPDPAGNRPPVLASLSPVTVAEGSLLQVGIAASDPDAGQQLAFSFAQPPPPGVVLLPAAGPVAALLAWTPSEAQGPSTNTLVIRATDNGLPALSTDTTLRVVVTEVNQPPVFTLVPPSATRVGEVFTFQLSADDPDRPRQALAFSKVAGPAGLSVSGPGLILWTPAAGEEGDRMVTVRVTDSGAPALSADQTFVLQVLPGTGLQVGAALQGGQLQLVFPVAGGVSYRVESSDLFPPQWSTLPQGVGVGAGAPVQVLDPLDPQRTLRLYRVVLP
ncbi:MAG: Ig-like domain-containing protein, partial [Verrucomicrobiota bacterium]